MSLGATRCDTDELPWGSEVVTALEAAETLLDAVLPLCCCDCWMLSLFPPLAFLLLFFVLMIIGTTPPGAAQENTSLMVHLDVMRGPKVS